MNGIIHPCCRPPGKPQPKSEKTMFEAIFEYIDDIMTVVKPRKVLFMAVDGVAPRAKMNQQRSRRYRTALEREETADREASIIKKWRSEGLIFTGEGSKGPSFDSNVITPGTEFMQNLSRALQLYIVERIHSNPLFKDLKIILSDAFVPGEGEHKLLEYIRSQRHLPEYDANTSHCIHGADADLIMLGLLTHEPHFYILRETVEDTRFGKKKNDDPKSGESSLQSF